MRNINRINKTCVLYSVRQNSIDAVLRSIKKNSKTRWEAPGIVACPTVLLREQEKLT